MGAGAAATSAAMRACGDALQFNLQRVLPRGTITRGEAVLGRVDHYLRHFPNFMPDGRDRIRVHVKLGVPDGYDLDEDEIRASFSYLPDAKHQCVVERVCGGLSHSRGTALGAVADPGAQDEESTPEQESTSVVVVAAVSLSYTGPVEV
jgi:hypothetical protein